MAAYLAKIQMPLNEPLAPATIYDETRKLFVRAPQTHALRLFMAGSTKAFAYVRVDGDKIHIESQAPWQEW